MEQSMQNFSVKINDNSYLTCLTVSKTQESKKVVEIPTNYILCLDVSGSMAYDLPKIREQLKKKLPKLLREKDTVSIIWFSGRNECGVLL